VGWPVREETTLGALRPLRSGEAEGYTGNGVARTVGAAGRRRAGARLALACALGAALAALGASSALAAYQHPTVTESFGPDGTSASTFTYAEELTFNQAEKRLYVLDSASGNTKIDAFDAPTTSTHTPAGGKFPIATANASNSGPFNQLATDNTTLGSAGNLYYLSGESGQTGGVQGFDSTGAPLGLGFPLHQPSSGGLYGVAVDGDGHVWVADGSNQKVDEYTSSGTTARNSIQTPDGETRQIAFDRSNGNLFVSGFFSGVFEYTAASGYTNPIEIESEQAVSAITVDSSSHTLYVVHQFPGGVTAYNSSGAPLEVFATSLGGTEDIAVDESDGTVYVAAANGKVNVLPGVVVPDVTTDEETGEATLNGHVDPAAGGGVSGCKFEYGTDTSYGSIIQCSPTVPPDYTAPTDVSADLSGSLTPETTYHYRLVATNANGTDYGADKTFTPHLVTGLHTDAATGVGKETVTLKAHFSGGGDDTDYYFEWGETTSYGSQSATPPGETITAPAGNTALSFEATQLDPGTTYHYRVVATNSEGTSLGEDRTFTTVKAVPDLRTEPSTDLSGTGGTLNGSYTGEAGIDVSCHFEYGTSASYGTSTPVVDQGSDVGAQSVGVQLDTLKELTTYHYRVVCHTDSSGDAVGQDELATTLALPKIAILPAGGYTSPDTSEPTAKVKVHATVNPQHGGGTTFHFDYGTTSAYGISTPESPLVGGTGDDNPVSGELTDLEPGTLYHYRLVATSSAGVKQSPDQTFTTVPLPAAVSASSATDVAPRGATLKVTVRPGSGATVVFFDYGPTADYGSSTPYSDPTPADEAEHELSTQIDGLSPGTTYHYRAVAVNFNGVTQGPDRTFTTPEEAHPGNGGSDGTTVPSPAPPPAPTPTPKKENCRKNFVKRNGHCVRRKQNKRRRHPKPAHGGRNG
jgi:hypothetical protein